MNMNMFFRNDGITSTHANYCANMAQERIQSLITKLNNLRFYETRISSLNSENKLMRTGTSDINFINSIVEQIAKANSFCAWVREAIKQKEKMLDSTLNCSLKEYLKMCNLTYPTQPASVPPIKEATESDIINKWSAEKRNKYLTLEAFASTYGKYIHPNGAISNARQEALTAANNPITKEGSGRDIILYFHTLTVSEDKINSEFLKLQEIYRKYEQELNAMKAEIKKELNTINLELKQEYMRNIDQHEIDMDNYYKAVDRLQNLFEQWQITEKERISNLKIFIPDSLKDQLQ